MMVRFPSYRNMYFLARHFEQPKNHLDWDPGVSQEELLDASKRISDPVTARLAYELGTNKKAYETLAEVTAERWGLFQYRGNDGTLHVSIADMDAVSEGDLDLSQEIQTFKKSLSTPFACNIIEFDTNYKVIPDNGNEQTDSTAFETGE